MHDHGRIRSGDVKLLVKVMPVRGEMEEREKLESERLSVVLAVRI